MLREANRNFITKLIIIDILFSFLLRFLAVDPWNSQLIGIGSVDIIINVVVVANVGALFCIMF